MLRVENVDCCYGQLQVLWDVSLHVDAGELVCLLGANGVGKSTLMKVISGLQHPSRGRVFFLEEDITSFPSIKRVSRGIVQVPEGRQLFPSMTVLENLELGAYIYRKIGRTAICKEMKRVFEIFPVLEERKNQVAGTLSGGEQQMLAIGRGLMSKPKMLLLDEPSVGLSPTLVARTFEIMQEIHRGGIPVLLVEQNAMASLSIADRGYVMETGKVVFEGTGTSLLHDNRVRTAYLAGS
jgi:branched-chain amino acid transport system ATP-binding protein